VGWRSAAELLAATVATIANPSQAARNAGCDVADERTVAARTTTSFAEGFEC
jgi:hypothetical protein